MIITTKFASLCPCCSQRIAVGSKVEWTKGSPAKHMACSQGPASAVSATPARRSYSGFVAGNRAVRAAEAGATLYVRTLSGHWVLGGPGALERAKRHAQVDNGRSTWIYGVKSSEVPQV